MTDDKRTFYNESTPRFGKINDCLGVKHVS